MPRVGVIKPSNRPTRAEELVAILPKEIELEHAACNIAQGTREELEGSFGTFKRHVDHMAALKVDLIHTAGVPFLLLGYDDERRLIDGWEREHGIPIFTNGMSQVNATRAFGAKRIVAASYFTGLDDSFSSYLTGAGFDVLAIEGFKVAFQEVPKLPAGTLRPFFDRLVLSVKGKAEALYLIGPAWRATLDMLDELEDAYGIPVIHHVPCQSWEIQRRLGFRQPFEGHGRLMREMPGA
jgi:maleate cis-trans isomerase